MRNVPPTPVRTLRRAREWTRNNGLRHVYEGNVYGEEDATATWCPHCGAKLVERAGFAAQRTGMDRTGQCAACGTRVAGVWE